MQTHESGYDIPRCHYYNNQKECPYFKVCCMYKHEKSGKCKAIICTRQMCQFEHEENMDVEEQNKITYKLMRLRKRKPRLSAKCENVHFLTVMN